MAAGVTSRPATAGGLLAILLWSATVAVSRSASEALGPLTAAAAVCGIGGALSLAWTLPSRTRRSQLRDLPRRYVLVCGGLFVAYMLLLFWAVGHAESRRQVLDVALLNYLWPVLTLLLTVVLLGRRARWALAPGTLAALVGLALVVRGDAAWSAPDISHSIAPYAAAVLAALCWASYSVLTRRWAGGRGDGAVAVFLPAAAVGLALASAVANEPRAWDLRAVLETTALGAATFVAYTAWDAAMRRGDVTLVAAASYLTPLLSTVVSCVYLGVWPGWPLWAGCGLLVVGSVVSWRSVDEGPPS